MSKLKKIRSLWYTDKPKWKEEFQKLRSTCKHEKTHLQSVDEEPAGITIRCLLCGKYIRITDDLPTSLKEKIKKNFELQNIWLKAYKAWRDSLTEPPELKELGDNYNQVLKDVMIEANKFYENWRQK